MRQVKHVRFNRESSMFTTCGSEGFRVFHVDKLEQGIFIPAKDIGKGDLYQLI